MNGAYDILKRKRYKIIFKKDKIVAISIFNDVYEAKDLYQLLYNVLNKIKVVEKTNVNAPIDPFNLEEFFNQQKS